MPDHKHSTQNERVGGGAKFWSTKAGSDMWCGDEVHTVGHVDDGSTSGHHKEDMGTAGNGTSAAMDGDHVSHAF